MGIFIKPRKEILFHALEKMTELMIQNVEAIEGDGGFDPIKTITYPITQFILVKNTEGLGNNDYTV